DLPSRECPPRATASGRATVDIMNDELTARQGAISFRIAGAHVKQICSILSRGETRFRKWWHRYSEAGPEALYGRTRASRRTERCGRSHRPADGTPDGGRDRHFRQLSPALIVRGRLAGSRQNRVGNLQSSGSMQVRIFSRKNS